MKKKIGIFFPLSGRTSKLKKSFFLENPKEFWYGVDYLFKKKDRFKITLIDSRSIPKNLFGKLHVYFDRITNRYSNFKFSDSRVNIVKNQILKNDLLISFTDSGSLSIGRLGLKNKKRKTLLIGGFHTLADSIDDVPNLLKKNYKKKIRESLKGLDHIFFFGDVDKQRSIELFNIPKEKTSLFRHSVDSEFWIPLNLKTNNTILSVGSDPRRDYATLIKSQHTYDLKILTRLNLGDLSRHSNVEILKGSFHNKAISNIELRNLYNLAEIIVVPIKDVFQPSGYSVTMQALACGKVVVLPNFKGLWDRMSFIHMENCILYKPEDAVDLGKKINLIMKNKKLRKKIEKNARKLAVKTFNLSRTNLDLLNLTNIFN